MRLSNTLGAVALASGILSAQTTRPMLDGHLKARSVIDAAVAAIGGPAALSALRQIEYTYRGSRFGDTQSYDPRMPASPSPFTAAMAVDFATGRSYQLVLSPPDGMSATPSPVFFRSDTVYTTNSVRREYSATPADSPRQLDGGLQFMPPIVLQRVMQNLRSVTYVGEDTARGRPADVVSFSWDAMTRVNLVLDKADHSIRRLRLLAPDPLIGDDEPNITFDGDTVVGGLRLSTHLITYQRGRRSQDLVLVAVRINQPVDPARFEVPAGYRRVAAPIPGAIATTQVADHLFEVSGLGGGIYRSQFLDVGDGVVVFEAPLGNGPTRRVVGEIRKAVGDKPIKYVVLSHYHDDHASGVGVYALLGATVVTVKDNEDILTRYAQAGSALTGVAPHPDLQLHFLDVGDVPLRLGAAAAAPVVYKVPNVPHVKDMLVLYDPTTRTIFNGDLFTEFFPASSASYRRFAEWLQSPLAPDVARVVGAHHAPMTKAELLERVASR